MGRSGGPLHTRPLGHLSGWRTDALRTERAGDHHWDGTHPRVLEFLEGAKAVIVSLLSLFLLGARRRIHTYTTDKANGESEARLTNDLRWNWQCPDQLTPRGVLYKKVMMVAGDQLRNQP